MTEHSPTPWRIIASADYYDLDDCEEPQVLSIVDANEEEVYYTEGGYFKPQPGDPELIVRAVNCHEELLEALERTVHDIETGGMSSLDAAHAAIAKARGQVESREGGEA